MYCPNCGNQINEGSRFCPHCGTGIATAPAPQPAPVSDPLTPQPMTGQPVYQPPQQNYQQPQQSYQQPQQSYQQPQQNYQQPQQNYQQPQQNYQQPQQNYQQPQQNYQQSFAPGAAAPVMATKKRSGKKGLLIGLGCVLLAALVAGGIWFLNRMKKSDNVLLRAAENSLSELKDYTSTLPNLHTIMENLEKLPDEHALRIAADLSAEYSYEYNGETMSWGSGEQVDVNLDLKNNRALINGSADVNGQNVLFSLYGDQEQIQLGSSTLLDEGEVLMLPVKDLPKQWNASALAELTGMTLPEDLDLDKDPDADLDTIMTDAYGEDWAKLRDSFDVIEYEGTPHFSDAGVTYTLTWDRETLKKMYDNTDTDFQELEDIDDLDDLEKLDQNKLAAGVLVSVLGEANEHIKELQFFVENDKLTGIYLQAEDDGDKSELELRLMGENNIWEHVQIRIVTPYSSYTVTETADFTMSKSNDQLRLACTFLHEDSDGEEYNYTEGPYALIYNDADGKLTVEEEGEPVEDLPELHLTPEEGGFRFALEQVDDDSYYAQSTKVYFTVSGKILPVAALQGKSVEILKLSEQELQELGERIENKLYELE